MASSTELERLIIRLVGDSTAYVKMLEDSATRTNRFAQQVGQDFQKLSLAIGAPLALIGTISAKTFADFETQIVRAGALISGITDDEFKAMQQEAKRLGATTVFSAVQSAEAMTVFARAGKRPQEIMSAMLPTLNLASAELISIAQAAEATSDVMTGMQIPADKLSEAIDTLGVASSASRTSVLDLSQGIRYAGPSARQMGVSLEDLTASLEVLAEAGIPGAQAGRGLRTVLARLASPTKEAKQWFDKLGISLFDAKGNFVGMEAAIQELGKGMDQLTQEQQIQFGTDVAGVFQLSTLQNLVEIGRKRFKDFRAQLNDTKGTLQEMADKQLNTLTGSLTLLTSTLEGAAIEIGEVMAPYIRMAADAVSYLATEFNNLSPSVKTLIVGTAALVTGFLAIGAAASTVAFLLSGIGPVVIGVVAGIAYWGAILTVVEQKTGLVSKAWNVLKTVAISTWRTVSKMISEVVEGIQPVADEIGKVFAEGWTEIQDFVDQVGPVLSSLWADIKEDFKDLGDLWHDLMPLRMFLFDLLKELARQWGKVFLANLKTTLEFVKGVIQLVREFYTYWRTTLQQAHAVAMSTFNMVKDGIMTALAAAEFGIKNLGKVWSAMTKLVGVTIIGLSADFKHFFTASLPAYGQFFVEYWQNLFSAIGKYAGEVLFDIVNTTIAAAKIVPAALAKGMDAKAIAKVIGLLFEQIGQREFKIETPKLDVKPREIGAKEMAAIQETKEALQGLDADFDKFLEEKLKRFEVPIKLKHPLDLPPGEDLAPDMKDVEKIGEDVGEALGNGVNDALDKFKPSERFESVLYGTAEALSRVLESRARLYGRDKILDLGIRPGGIRPNPLDVPGMPPVRPGAFPRDEFGPGPQFPPPNLPRPQNFPRPLVPLIPPMPPPPSAPKIQNPFVRPNLDLPIDPQPPGGIGQAPVPVDRPPPAPRHDVKQEEMLTVLKEIRDELKVITKAQAPILGGGLR